MHQKKSNLEGGRCPALSRGGAPRPRMEGHPQAMKDRLPERPSQGCDGGASGSIDHTLSLSELKRQCVQSRTARLKKTQEKILISKTNKDSKDFNSCITGY
ncbi:hypothetical protein CDAR_62781 [Caerostris darwini]|uniref:Uncharacterized protein n=1 Tax=Caerostris darwini TaxID=1538125 RepID=A0AAV4UF75_9ARAC|nr:hypothetical protein CDAR_62781 [Caerostris darwini]